MSNSTLKLLPVLMVAITAALLTQPVFGTSIPVITFTEKSNTDLTAVYTDGSGATTNLTVTPDPSSTDVWSVTTPSYLVSTGNQATWSEPSSTNSLNVITGFALMPVFFVSSDLSGGPGLFANNTRSTFAIAAVPGAAPVLVYGVFNDLGDSAAGVPDTGTTASLFGLSLAGLAFLRRKVW
jgi:VPDSG-CTERM motif